MKHAVASWPREWSKTLVMQELPVDAQRTTHIHLRGSFLDPGDEVRPQTPATFPAMAKDFPRNRLGLARWLVDRDNPLTARVTVNRLWEQLFGAGIVVSSEDFGSQGTLPTHPGLLDWLAVEFMENGWWLKDVIRTIVVSATYRQSSRILPEKLAVDPENRLLSRGPRTRLSAEQLRDQALAVSGLLSGKRGGPSVMPPQPEGVWQVVYNDDAWVTSAGEDRYRRGIYTFWRRTSPYPSAIALDATSRESCTFRRFVTNTPVAAFTLLNDPAYVEAAQAFARRVLANGEQDEGRQIERAYELLLSRRPRPEESQRVRRLLATERAHFASSRDAALLLTGGDQDQSSDARRQKLADLAAWTVVSNILLNLDEALSN